VNRVYITRYKIHVAKYKNLTLACAGRPTSPLISSRLISPLAEKVEGLFYSPFPLYLSAFGGRERG